MSRRTRRDRASTSLVDTNPTEARPLTPIERDRLRQRYARLTGRSVVLGYTSLGTIVPAWTPEELVAATDAALIEGTRRQRPS